MIFLLEKEFRRKPIQENVSIGTRDTFADVGATTMGMFGIEWAKLLKRDFKIKEM